MIEVNHNHPAPRPRPAQALQKFLPMENTDRQEHIDKVAELIKDIRFAFLTTIAEDGSLHSRPMAMRNSRFDGTLYFFTPLASAKVQETDRRDRVSVTFANPSRNDYVALSGFARTYQDRGKAQELWDPAMKTWFPKGLDDPNLAIMEVMVDRAEYWDSPSSAVVHLFGVAVATLTGRPPGQAVTGEHASVQL